MKIGYARNPRDRLGGLRTANPRRLTILGVMEGSLDDEQALHERFGRHRVRGEWFVLCYDIVQVIEQHCKPVVQNYRHTAPRSEEPLVGSAPDGYEIFVMLASAIGAFAVYAVALLNNSPATERLFGVRFHWTERGIEIVGAVTWATNAYPLCVIVVLVVWLCRPNWRPLRPSEWRYRRIMRRAKR